ncbi:MAG: hypothetical protein WC492_03195 [Candidatus Micrarchaeia archaeon]
MESTQTVCIENLDIEAVIAKQIVKLQEKFDSELLHKTAAISTLCEKVETLEHEVKELQASAKIIYVEEVPFEDAYKKVLTYLDKNREAYASDVAEACNLDIEVVLKIFTKLQTEGKLRW